jgi:leader peptidase (prepilin peptidase)/N-methyltransferase
VPLVDIFVVAVSGLLGLLIGSFLNVVAVRVPAGASLMRESRCPQCDAAIKPSHNVPVLGWLVLRGRCASCGERISARYPIVEAITGALFALVAWLILATSTTPLPATLVVLVAFLYFAAISVVLTVIDLDTHRLPDAIVLPSYVVAAVLLATACVLGADWAQLLGCGIGMAILYAFYFVLRVVRPGGMGGGDVKLAGVVGMYLGWLGWGALAVGAFAAFVLGGIFSLALIGAKKAGRRTAIPFGPWMIAGAWVGIVFGQALGAWYMSLLAV